MKSIPLKSLRIGAAAAFISLGFASSAGALELDWSGQFRTEFNWLHNYGMDNSDGAGNFSPVRNAANGYYIPSGGSQDATFQTLFLKLRPKIIVNDNIYIKSEFWVGDPVYGIFGNGVPYSLEQRQFFSTQSRGSVITAQRFWAELLSDIGTVQVGRAPLHWGLGIVWNNGDGMWDRYQSTGDTLRMVSKFGAFSIMPSFILYSAGNNIGGACNFTAGACTPTNGDGGVREYSLALKYENSEEDIEGGVNFIKRLAGAAQDPNPAGGGSGYVGPQGVPVGMNYNVWDIYGRKRFGRFSLAAEIPFVTGSLGTPTTTSLDYSAFAVATEFGFKVTDNFDARLKAGRAPGQPSFGSATPDNFRAFFFNPAYRVGLIMFNYNLSGFGGPNTQNNSGVAGNNLRSPYDHPIVNANYLALGGTYKLDKWSFSGDFIYASAVNTATANNFFYNADRRAVSTARAIADQESLLGVEADLGARFQWDESFQFKFDMGVMLPGGFHKFSNVAGQENLTAPVYAISLGAGINF